MLKNVTLECSLKPFKKLDDAYITSVCEQIFNDWAPICAESEMASVMLWIADGSEILDYKGNLDEEFEWARYAGGCNTRVMRWYPDRDPQREGLHSRSYIYTENPPVFTYRKLKQVINTLKMVGSRVLGGKPVRVGATFDPGPEFANSTFKYDRHREICAGSTMGFNNFIYANTTLHADNCVYAGFPNGIPEGLPFGTFLGRQSQHFLTDLGFDYLWFSNGLGFGRDTWATTGAVFDGKEFQFDQIDAVREDVFSFWRYFRAECPDFPIETRGTNLSVGIDYSKDGVPLYDIYNGGFGMLPPPNSPWAALDGDFGLELMGYLSRIAELPPEENYLYRYYIHDPWWINSPWYDRYQGQAHDIYMPLSCARINKKGEVQGPTHMSLLTIDNTFGDMPASCVREPLPHLLKGLKEKADAVAPVVWVYPFREYCQSSDAGMMNRMFSGDWFVRGAINHGFPLTMVVSSDNFQKHDASLYQGAVLFAPIPEPGTDFEASMLSYANGGGKVLFYGSVDNASKEMLKCLGLTRAEQGVSGVQPITVGGEAKGNLSHDKLTGAGEINALPCPGTKVLASSGKYALATVFGRVAWVRGCISSDYKPTSRLLVPQDEHLYYPTETLALVALAELGWDIRYEKEAGQRSPVVLFSRYDNAFMLSSYLPSTTVKTSIKTPLGAPVFIAYETKLENGYSTYYFPKAEHKECRFFVSDMEDGIVSCKELPPVSFIMRRRIGLSGLKDATVRIFAENYCKDNVNFTLDGVIDEYTVSKPIDVKCITDEHGTYFEARHVTGNLVVSMPRPDYKPQPLSEWDKDVNIVEGVPDYM